MISFDTAFPLIQYNDITGGSAGSSSSGICLIVNSFGTIQYNTIKAGDGTGWTAGIDITDGSMATVKGDTILYHYQDTDYTSISDVNALNYADVNVSINP